MPQGRSRTWKKWAVKLWDIMNKNLRERRNKVIRLVCIPVFSMAILFVSKPRDQLQNDQTWRNECPLSVLPITRPQNPNTFTRICQVLCCWFNQVVYLFNPLNNLYSFREGDWGIGRRSMWERLHQWATKVNSSTPESRLCSISFLRCFKPG